MSPHDPEKQPDEPDRRSGPKVNWALLLVVLFVTWAAMAYLIYRVIASAEL